VITCFKYDGNVIDSC